ncbi:PREDICTED: probable U3 small nucleolar RNA-associated protein 11 [Cyprinodon variegatus]|uniref:Probable U3 small nucleolar RNA-associated protein 11 n=1 Tax=Cyprinodon variegatus TaxID=28743 RepID=A0A3Q2EIP4_CYPVA|nr:PREDICTED: probable U3 small nucleolar RNA-associated protein 11 [Cyprinodon variegatus]
MSSFRKALKSKQRNHHERSQLVSRKTLGLLEKKKDYKLRADDYHKKQNTLAALRKKAMEKNPDEFYFNMISSKLEDGVHVMKKTEEEVTEEQKKVMRTQDIKYVEMKRVAEAKVCQLFQQAVLQIQVDKVLFFIGKVMFNYRCKAYFCKN